VMRLARLLRGKAQRALATAATVAESAAPAVVEKQLRFSAILSQASKVVQGRIAASRLRDEPPDYLISVPSDIGLFDFQFVAEAIACGRETANAALPGLKAALAEAGRRSRIRSLGRWWPRREGPNDRRAQALDLESRVSASARAANSKLKT
ncbi:MAG: hypothetical protein ACREQY_15115, partial [Candidatus Binatia bacterium]